PDSDLNCALLGANRSDAPNGACAIRCRVAVEPVHGAGFAIEGPLAERPRPEGQGAHKAPCRGGRCFSGRGRHRSAGPPRRVSAPRDAGAAEALTHIGLFQGLSRRDLTQVAEMAKGLDFAAGQAITEEGDRGGRFYVLLEGQADVLVGGEVVTTLK